MSEPQPEGAVEGVETITEDVVIEAGADEDHAAPAEPDAGQGAAEQERGAEQGEAAPAEPETASIQARLEPDEVLLASRDIARAALAEITDAQTIGADEGHELHEAHVLTLFFECRLPGYPGWRWAATLARVDEESPVNVLEVELLPGEGAVVAPEWVPWSVRLAQYREVQARQAADEAAAAEAAAAELSDEDEVDPEDDLLENDFSDFEDEIDGVDVDGDEDDSDEDDDTDDDDESDEDESGDDDTDDDEDDDEDEDGFADLDEHDLHDHPLDEVDFEHEDDEEDDADSDEEE